MRKSFLIFTTSTGRNGETATSSTEDSRAKTSPLQGEEQAFPVCDPDYGQKCSGWSQKYAHIGSWLKTFVEQSLSPSIPSVPVWKMKDTSSGRSCFLLLRLERRTEENGSSSSRQERMWPTPSQRDWKGANGPEHFANRDRPHAVFVYGRRREHLTELTEDRTSEEAAAI